MFKNEKRVIGNRGEKIARQYLTRSGYHVLEKNYQCRFGEIDIIVKNSNEIIFIEVKLRNATRVGCLELPESAVTPKKISKIKKTAQIYILENKLSPEKEYRFDVISIIIQNNKVTLKHLKYAFQFLCLITIL